jgi:DnaJ-class molecular chaperone
MIASREESTLKKSKVNDASMDSAFSGLSNIISGGSGILGAVKSCEFKSETEEETLSASLMIMPIKGRTLKTTLVISIMDSAAGGSKTIAINRQRPCGDCLPGDAKSGCMQCMGEGVMSESVQTLVSYPPGVQSGFASTYQGVGDVSSLTQPAGDLIVEIQVEPHAFLRRLGNDCHADLPVSMVQASLGAKLRIPSLTGHVLVLVPPGTQPGEFLSLPLEGFPEKSGHKGNMVVRLVVTVPSVVDPEIRALLKQFDKAEKSARKINIARI